VSNVSETNLSETTESRPSSRGVTLRRIFVGEDGIRAGWSALLFCVIFLALQTVARAGLGHFISLDTNGPIPLGLALLQESSQVLIVFLATAVVARIERRRILSYGYIGRHKGIRLVSGLAWELLCLSALVGVLWKAGWLILDGWSLSGFLAWKYALAWVLIFLLVGVFEESTLRGYLQYTLSRGIGFWWAASLLSVVFVLGHAGNGGESPLGLVEVGVAGFYFCFSLWLTKSRKQALRRLLL
jgi:membrane protease YdiL (CAAX protease family)